MAVFVGVYAPKLGSATNAAVDAVKTMCLDGASRWAGSFSHRRRTAWAI